MVGIPGKSQGCNTCRRRKIRCDLQQPQCGQCVRSNRECGGYQRETTFLNRTASGLQRRRPSAREASSTIAVEATGPPAASGPRFVSPPGDRIITASTSPRMLAQIDNYLMYRDGFINTFLGIYLPASAQSRSFGLESSLSWLAYAASLPEPGDALSSALCALSIAYIGRMKQDQRLQAQGVLFYGRALREMQKALWDSNQMWKEETLAAGTALSTYELYESTGDDYRGWTGHELGIQQLIGLRGPERYESPFAHILYEDRRYTSMIRDIQYRKSSFLKEPVWLSKPWEGRPKGIEQRLYDIGFDLAAVLEFADRIGAISDNAETTKGRMELLDTCHQLNDRFQIWYDEFINISPSPLYWPTLSTFNGLQGGVNPFPVSFQFSNLRLAEMIVTYWSLQLILSGTIAMNSLALRQTSSPPNPTLGIEQPQGANTDTTSKPRSPNKHIRASILILAGNIAQSVEYCMQSSMGLIGSLKIVFPLRIAMGTFQRQPGPELAWCQAMFQKLTEEKGLRFSQSIASAGKGWGSMKNASSQAAGGERSAAGNAAGVAEVGTGEASASGMRQE